MKTYYGAKQVAQWCGVTAQCVSMWMLRYNDDPTRHDPYPEPVIELVSGARTTYGWSENQRMDWEAYALAQSRKPGALIVGMRKDRRK